MKKTLLVILFFIAVATTWIFEACKSGCQSDSFTSEQKIGTEFDK